MTQAAQSARNFEDLIKNDLRSMMSALKWLRTGRTVADSLTTLTVIYSFYRSHQRSTQRQADRWESIILHRSLLIYYSICLIGRPFCQATWKSVIETSNFLNVYTDEMSSMQTKSTEWPMKQMTNEICTESHSFIVVRVHHGSWVISAITSPTYTLIWCSSCHVIVLLAR